MAIDYIQEYSKWRHLPKVTIRSTNIFEDYVKYDNVQKHRENLFKENHVNEYTSQIYQKK